MAPGATALSPNPHAEYAGVQTPDQTHYQERPLKSWAIKYAILGNAAQVLVGVGIFVYSFGLLFEATPLYSDHLKNTISSWWGVSTSTASSGGGGATAGGGNGQHHRRTAESSSSGHSEMVEPTFYVLFCVLPMLVSAWLVHFLRNFNVRRISSYYVLKVARVLRRKPTLFKRVSYFSYGELIFLLFILGGNIFLFGIIYAKKTVSSFDQFLKVTAEIFGYNCLYCMAYLFLPATRNSAWMEFMNISYANAIKYHRWLAVATVVTAVIHTALFYWMWIRSSTWKAQALPCFDCDLGVKAGKKVWINVFGELALLCFLAMSATSIPWVRRHMYNTFYYVHQLLFPAVVFTIMHYDEAIWWLVPTFALYVMSRVVSHTNSFTPVEVKEFTCLDDDIIKIVISRSAERSGDYKVGQFVYLNVPTLSKLQWHAFTISSSPRTNATSLTILLKSLGDWTKELVDYADECKKSNTLPTMYMDGYYGASLEMYDEYSTVCLIGGGIGVTPMFAILEDMVAKLSAHKIPTQRVVFLFSFRELSLLEEIHPTLAKLRELDPHGNYFTMQLYLTRLPSDDILNQSINHFKNHVQPTQYAGNKVSACPFAQSLSSPTNTSMAYTSTLVLAVFLVAFMEYGNGKIDANHATLWPVQLFVEAMLLTASAAIVYGIIFVEKKLQKDGMNATMVKKIEAFDVFHSPGAIVPSSDVHTLGDLITQYSVTVGHRPDMEQVMAQTLDAHRTFTSSTSSPNVNPSIGVFVSGPEAMKSAMVHAVAEIGSHHFDIHEEEFEL